MKKSVMKKIALPVSILFVLVADVSPASASASASATMAVSITVASSLSFVIQSDASGLALTNSGTSAVTASFGTMSTYGGTAPTGVTRTVNAPTDWKISTPFDSADRHSNDLQSRGRELHPCQRGDRQYSKFHRVVETNATGKA